MAPMSRGSAHRVQKVQRSKSVRKSGTATTKKHRFQSFSERVSRFNVDPVRRAQGRAHAHQQEESSHFAVSFQEWRELNMSENFGIFVKQVAPLCSSLPQILHYEQQIVDFLLQHIEKGDALSLEPLLGLAVHLARDLGVRFEVHFERVVAVVSRLAASHTSIEVIEWSFTCLAWLFKYLSRLLVLDLRPLFKLMSPLLGRTHQRDFVTTFAAEALSFLIRKAAASYTKNQSPLRNIVLHAFEDLASAPTDQALQYQRGLSVLFTTAITGLQRRTHSQGDTIFTVLLMQLLRDSRDGLSMRTREQWVVEYVLSDVLQHTDAEGFAPILNAFVTLIDRPPAGRRGKDCHIALKLMFLMTSTRGGNKIYNWTIVLQQLLRYVDMVEVDLLDTQSLLLNTVAVAAQYAPFDELLPVFPTITKKLDHDFWAPFVLPFCSFAANMSVDRFKALILPELQRFILSRWGNYRLEICLTLLKLRAYPAVSDTTITFPAQARIDILEAFNSLTSICFSSCGSFTQEEQENALSTASQCNCYIDILNAFPHLDSNSAIVRPLLELLDCIITSNNARHVPDSVSAFAATKGFEFLAEQMSFEELKSNLLGRCFHIARDNLQRPIFLKALLTTLRRLQPHLVEFEPEISSLTAGLVNNLASASHEVRMTSLEILQAICPATDGKGSPGLDAAVALESSSFGFENARGASMAVRRLGSIFEESTTSSLTRQALASYCFGLLHVRLASVWEDACNALRSMSNIKSYDEQIVERAIRWLETPLDSMNVQGEAEDAPAEPSCHPPYYDGNVHMLEGLTSEIAADFENVQKRLVERLGNDGAPDLDTHASNRSKALRVLKAVPALAERRSRVLVPVLLNWSPADIELIAEESTHASDDLQEEEPSDSVSIHALSPWSRVDQKALLGLFACFKNPTVLYRSAEVYQALLGLLCNGDSEIQRSALEAIMAWDHASLKTHKEHLTNLLDDARFRDEVTVFLNIDEAESEIRLEHRTTLMPVLLRLLYGRVVSQTGSTSTRGTQKSRRRAVITSLARFGTSELESFLKIALGPLSNIWTMDAPGVQRCLSEAERLSPRKQVGMLRLLKDVVEILAGRVSPFVPLVLDAVLYCLVRASRMLLTPVLPSNDHREVELPGMSLQKDCRHEGIGCLVALFEACPEFEWGESAATIIREVVNPRLEKLSIESSQSVSGLLRLFATWSKFTSTIPILMEANHLLLHRVAECLAVPSTQDEVKLFVLKDIVEPLLECLPVPDADRYTVESATRLVEDALRNDLGQVFVDNTLVFIQQRSTKEVLDRAVEVLPRLAMYIRGKPSVRALITSCLYMLQQPPKIASPRTKGKVLSILKTVLYDFDFGNDDELFNNTFDALSALFSYFKDNQNRHVLVSVFSLLGQRNNEVKEVTTLCEQLNAFSSARLDQPDYNTRLQGMQFISDGELGRFSSKQWNTIVHNMLFLMKDDDEFSMRTSASLCLRKFVRQACVTCEGSDPLTHILTQALLPALERGMSEPSELIRTEYVSVLSELVNCSWSPVTDMVCLQGPDDESSFFKNILHIQNHRRLRALRRLASDSTLISSQNIARFCLPLTENFFVDAEVGDSNLAGEALYTLEALAGSLEWHRYRSLLQRLAAKAAKMESKFHIRTFGAVVNSLYRAVNAKSAQVIDTDGEQSINNDLQAERTLVKSLPEAEALAKSVMSLALSKLMEIVHFKDETTVDLRVLLAPMAVKLLMILPKQQIDGSLPTILMDVCNILRSKAQEARDSARKALAEIAALIGSNYFGFIVKQLRSALSRGSQLHVLSYTIHSVLVASGPSFKPGDIDYCLPELIEIVVNDIFGTVGQEKEAAEYISRMKEVKKKSLSFDSVEILASITTLGQISVLLDAIREPLTKPRPKINHVDEMLRRIREGLRRNDRIQSQDSLTLSFEILQDAYNRAGQGGMQASLVARKMASFALELLRRILDKYENFKTPEKMTGFLPMLRRSIDQEDEEVQIAAMRLVTSIIKVPVPEFDENAKLYIRIARKLIDASPSTNTLVAQAAIRMLSAILRERPHAQIPKSDFDNNIAYLLRRIKPDLQTPGRQGERDQQIAAFNFLRAVVGRKEPVAEVYEVMDVVREVMISGAEAPVPELARSVYSRFVLEYFPDGTKGFSKQLDFLAANLQYQHSRGRLSVMEVIMFVLTHKNETAVQDVLSMFFLPLVVALATDGEQECRDSAGLLLRKIFGRADKERAKTFKAQMGKWMDADADTLWTQAGLQCWTIYFDVNTNVTKEAATMRGHIDRLLHASGNDYVKDDQQLLLRILQLFKKLCDNFPTTALAPESRRCWSSIIAHFRSGSDEVRAITASLLNLYMTDFMRAAAKLYTPKRFPLIGSHGLELDVVSASTIARHTLKMMQSETSDAMIDQASAIVALTARLSLEANSDELLTDIFAEAAAVIRLEGTGQPPRAKVAAAKLLLALTNMASAEKIVPSLAEILLPLNNLMDTAIPTAASSDPSFNDLQEQLIAAAQELLSAIQTKMGTSTYIASMQGVQKVVKQRREERRSKRQFDAVSAPERTEKKRQKKHETQKTKRREKNTLAAGKRRGW